MVNITSYLRYHAQREPDRLAVVYQGRRITYGALLDHSLRVAALLASKGVSTDDVVCLLMKNSPAFLEIAFAISHLGAVMLPINYRLAAEEVAFIVDDANGKLLFVDDELAHLAPPSVERIEVDDAAQHDGSSLVPPVLEVPAMQVRDPNDLYRLMYTSGTTSHPKGVMLSYQNFYWKNIELVTTLGLNRETRALTVGPLYHVGGLDAPGIATFWVGAMMALHREFDAEAVVQSIQDEQLNFAWMAPVMTSQILALPNRNDYDVSSMRTVVGGGERTPESRIRAFGEYFTNGRYVDAFGMTESCALDTAMDPGREIEKIGSVGRHLCHVQIQIRDDDGNPLPAGSEGEICMRGPKITKGYWNNPEKTAESFFGDWLRTGDVGHMDEDGFLYITDRKKDMIISGGENIASSEVERVVYLLPQIAECAVIGVPDERWGEKPLVVAALKSGEELDYETLEAHCREHLAGFKVPKGLRLVEALPRNPSGKILKRVLRDGLAGEVASETPDR